jgi:hypothetical protein
MSSEERIVSDQADEQDGIESSKNKELALTRRDFLHKTMAVTSALAISSMLPSFVTDAWAEAAAAVVCPPGQPLQHVMEIKSVGKTLKAILKILDDNMTYLAPGCVTNTGQMRYISGLRCEYQPALKDALGLSITRSRILHPRFERD